MHEQQREKRKTRTAKKPVQSRKNGTGKTRGRLGKRVRRRREARFPGLAAHSSNNSSSASFAAKRGQSLRLRIAAMQPIIFHLLLDRIKVTINLLRKSDIFRNHGTVRKFCISHPPTLSPAEPHLGLYYSAQEESQLLGKFKDLQSSFRCGNGGQSPSRLALFASLFTSSLLFLPASLLSSISFWGLLSWLIFCGRRDFFLC